METSGLWFIEFHLDKEKTITYLWEGFPKIPVPAYPYTWFVIVTDVKI